MLSNRTFSFLQIAAKKHILQYAIKFQDFEFVKMLCDAGADVNMLVRVNNYFWVGFNIGIKHAFLCINICWAPRVVLKPEPGRRGF